MLEGLGAKAFLYFPLYMEEQTVLFHFYTPWGWLQGIASSLDGACAVLQGSPASPGVERRLRRHTNCIMQSSQVTLMKLLLTMPRHRDGSGVNVAGQRPVFSLATIYLPSAVLFVLLNINNCNWNSVSAVDEPPHPFFRFKTGFKCQIPKERGK